jgi:acetyl esterase
MSDAVPPIDPGMLAFYKALSEKSPPEAVTWPLDRQRKEWDELCRSFRAPRPERLIVEDLDADGVKVRVYRPPGEAPKPGVVYGHGGGWVLGSIETHDDMCAEMAAFSDTVVVAVDYRLAPEHPHPAQLDDCRTVLAWMRERGRALGIDPEHILAAGDSAGGQMTAGLALYLRDRGEEQLKGMVLIYPGLGSDMESESYRRNADAPCLSRAEMLFFLESFLGPREGPNWCDPYALPNLATDVSGLPPAFITVAAHDPLHDDGVRFAEKLRKAGVPVTLRRELALAHSYMRARHHSPPAMTGFRAIAAAVHSLGHTGVLPSSPFQGEDNIV